MNRFVLDASTTIAWLFIDEATEYSESILVELSQGRARALVPPLWQLEVTNVLLSKIRRKHISFSQATDFLKRVRELDIHAVLPSADENFDAVFPLAHDEKLTSYDATYLHLAQAEDVPLASLDVELCKAAKRLGVKIFRSH
jgi:predicted nucleic acid-binding protein